jgi:hypothetical protein
MENNLNDNDDNKPKIEKPKQDRYKKYKYQNERKDITKQLLQVLKINGENKMFNSYDLDHDEETQKKILDMIPNIEKYYTVASWSYYRKEKKKERPYLSIIKSVLKDMSIHFDATVGRKTVDNKINSYSIYNISTNIDIYLL